MMGYPGGKNGAGVWQRIVNQIPPHDVWVSAFAGDCAVTRHLRPAAASILIDRDPEVLRRWETRPRPRTLLYAAEAMAWLRFAFQLPPFDKNPPTWRLGGVAYFSGVVRGAQISGLVPRVFVYVDPPYHPATLSSRLRYRFGMTAEDHAALLEVLQQLPCAVLIHGYPCAQYDAALRGWRSFRFQAMTRGGLRTEQVWCNYPQPEELHDYRQVGTNKRQRERIRRRCRNWRRSIERMGVQERGAVLAALQAACPSDSERADG